MKKNQVLFNKEESQVLNKIKLNVKEYDDLFRKGLELLQKVPDSEALFLNILEEYEERLLNLPPTELELEKLKDFDENLQEKVKALILFGTQAALLNENAKMQKKIRAINQKYKDLLSVVTHEFKNALTSIYGYNRILKKRVEHQQYENLLPLIDSIDRLSKNLFSMVDTLFNMSLIEEGKLTINRQNFVFEKDIIEPLKREFSDLLADKKQNIVLEKNRDNIVFYGDLHLMLVVFRNLLLNAIQYGNKDSNIRISFFTPKDHLEIHFFNYGMGIEERQIPHIYEKFSRFNKLQSPYNVGLGLFTVKSIIEMHGGKITVESVPGEWVRFIILLPNAPTAMEKENG